MLISSEADFHALMPRLLVAKQIAIDTEFITGVYYQAKIALVQIALNDQEVFAIDPLAYSIRTLGEVLRNPEITKIFHAGDQDIAYLYHETGEWTQNIFDTQSALGFLGEKSAQSLQKVVHKFTGITLPKSAQQSDWLNRPITKKQIEYALNDVRYLPQIYWQLKQDLTEKGKSMAYHQEIAHRYATPKAERIPSILQLNGYIKLPTHQKQKALALFEYREQVAIKDNIHRSRLMTDEALLRLTRIGNPTVQQLEGIHGIHPKFAQKYGQKALDTLSHSYSLSLPEPQKKDHVILSDHELLRVDFIQLWLKTKAVQLGIDAPLLVSRNEAEHLLKCHLKHTELKSHHYPQWKKAIFIELLDALATHELQIKLCNNRFEI